MPAQGPLRDGRGAGAGLNGRAAPQDGAPALIETMLRRDGVYPRRAGHMARLARSCAALGRPLDMAAVEAALDAAPAGGLWRVRLTLDSDGRVEVAWTPFAPLAPGAVWRVAISAVRLDPADPWLGHKTTRRAAYEAARAAAPPGVDEALLLNLRGELCEGAITNVFVDRGAGLETPPLSCGLLPGVLRAELLAAGRAREARLRPEDLRGARLFVGNALRGLIPARLVG